MGITAKKGTVATDAWGSPDSFLLVFFPDDPPDSNPSPSPSPNPNTQTTPTLKHHPDSTLQLSASRRTRSRHLLLSRAQSTISVCALLLSLTLLLFALSSLDNSPSVFPRLRARSSTDSVPYSSRSVPFSILWRRRSTELKSTRPGKLPPPFALQGMGVLHRRGSHAMPDLIVGHVSEETTEDGLRLFLRTLHRSGLTARSDVVLIFPDRSLLSGFSWVIRGEDDAFLRLLDRHLQGNHTTVRGNTSASGKALNFEAAPFVKKSKKDKEAGEPLWGKRTRSNYSETGAAETDLTTRPSYGSVVSFEAGELDLEGSLYGFLDHVPMSLRRWSCYSMLLGRLRRNFKHVMLVDVKNCVILSDPFVGVRDRSSETVMVWGGSNTDGKRHGRGKKESGADSAQHGLQRVNTGIVVGGMRGVRRMTEAMQMEIVRGAMRIQQRKGRRKGGGTTTALAESGVMSQLVGNELLLKNIELVVSREDDSAATLELTSNHKGNNNNSNKMNNLMFMAVGNKSEGEIRKLICSSEADLSEIYSDCLQVID